MPLATIGIVSIGDMGLGIAKLLMANDYTVTTNVSDRSQATKNRAANTSIGVVDSDLELVKTCDFVFSIVPPRDAIATAKRISQAASDAGSDGRTRPLYFFDLNAISPRSCREIQDICTQTAPDLKFVDGGIIGGPPKQQDDGTWSRPSIPMSGPYRLDEAQPSGKHLFDVLNARHIKDTIGAATGLKMCYASLSKGFTALTVQSYTAAQNLGVLQELQAELDPSVRSRAERGIVSMPPKAYRWVNEMEQIAETFEADGGFSREESIFRSVARVYEFIADGTDLGKEVTEDRQRGKTPEDFAALVTEGTERRKLKKD
ncbi:unnamed protein product [Zymoseptoria tritici ST99CH_3D1]|nr:unnamed protein product [Zymoseptoria tritici ST99CH_3D1]